jgi:hypothetical protein
MDLPQMRRNIATWWVLQEQLPALSHFLHDVLPNETFDPHFLGQKIETTYFDTAHFALRAARQHKQRYLTLRLRCYDAPGREELYALSAKTESEKWRQEIPTDQAEAILAGELAAGTFLPAHLLVRLQQFAAEEPVLSVVKVCCRRYAVEDLADRYTLDVGVVTDTGKCLPAAVLEHKSLDPESTTPPALRALKLRPTKLSKFLWATSIA